MIATEPLADDVWDEIGIEHGQTFSDYRHLLIYGQRTADNRFAFGGRGASYHWGSTVDPAYERVDQVFEHLHGALRDLFPAVGDARVTHRWGGPLGDRPRLARHRELQPEDRRRLRGRVRRRRAVDDEPRRSHAGRPRAGSRHAS